MKDQTLWNAIFSSGAPHFGKKNQKKGITRYLSTEELLLTHMQGGQNMPLDNVRSAIDGRL